MCHAWRGKKCVKNVAGNPPKERDHLRHVNERKILKKRGVRK
jgi:hypothetical protein